MLAILIDKHGFRNQLAIQEPPRPYIEMAIANQSPNMWSSNTDPSSMFDVQKRIFYLRKIFKPASGENLAVYSEDGAMLPLEFEAAPNPVTSKYDKYQTQYQEMLEAKKYQDMLQMQHQIQMLAMQNQPMKDQWYLQNQKYMTQQTSLVPAKEVFLPANEKLEEPKRPVASIPEDIETGERKMVLEEG